MSLPDFIRNFPSLDVPFPKDVVRSNAIRSDAGLVVFFTFIKDMVLPPHAHGAQWGTVVAGEIEFTIDGKTGRFGPGDCYDIPADVVHSATIRAGSIVIDVFAEADRYRLKV